MKLDLRPPEGVEFYIPPLTRNPASLRAGGPKATPAFGPAFGRAAVWILALGGLAYVISSVSPATLLLVAGAIALLGAGLIYTAAWSLDNIR